MDSAQLQELAAKEAIRRLVAAYCDAVARRDADAAGALFAPDAAIRIAGFPELSGRAAITEGMRASFAAAAFLHQRCDPGLIDVAGNAAQARHPVFEVIRRPDENALGLVFGFYEDRYVRLAEGWRFARRRYAMQSRVLLPAEKVQDAAEFVPELAFAV